MSGGRVEWWGIVDIYRDITSAYLALKGIFTEYSNDIEDTPLHQSIQLYPNPATDRIMLTVDQPLKGYLQFTISTIFGLMLASDGIEANGYTVEIPLTPYGLPKGAYVLCLKGESVWLNSLLFIQ
jgi:hypothetical protein